MAEKPEHYLGMMMINLSKTREEQGVAMITVIILSAVLMMLGGGMYYVSSGEIKITKADYVGSQAFYYAEGGIENVIDIINYSGTEQQLIQQRADQSSNGSGYLMDPIAAQRQDPPDPIQMRIGDETYTVWVDEVTENGTHCQNCGLNLRTTSPAYLLITAEGQSGLGYRKLQQQVKLQASGFPMTLYVDGNVNANGNVSLTNQSMFVRGNFYGRDKLAASGNDLPFGGISGIFATGSIYAKANGGNSQIYTAAGGHSNDWKSSFANDRDSRGAGGKNFLPGGAAE